jgi:lipopolysaccharide biosynthesis glycosyltransferase
MRRELQHEYQAGVQVSTLAAPPPPIHVCYTPEDTDEQISRMIRSMRSVLVSALATTRDRLVFHIFGNKLTKLDGYLGTLKRSAELPKGIKVYRGATDLVPKKRKVHSSLKKLAKDEVYVRFFIPSILDESVDKFLYLDTDTAVFADLAAVYDQVLKGKYTLAAGVQNKAKCNLGKMLVLSDPRLQALGIKSNDECLSGGAFFVDRWRWLKENRTQRWQHWINENYKKQLYYLGCMPPQMIDFHNQWEQLPSTWLRDFKGHKCCPPKYSGSLLLNGQSVIVHPFKNIEDAGDFRHYFEATEAL